MLLIILSFFAGLITVLTPCSFSLLPIILGGGLTEKNKSRSMIIIISAVVSIFLFIILIRLGVNFLNLSDSFLSIISGSIIIFLALTFLFPNLWDRISERFNLSNSSQKMVTKSSKLKGVIQPILIGASLGPIFTSCSPTLGYIIAVTLKENLFFGILNIISYLAGLTFVLLLVVFLGRKALEQFKWSINPQSNFKKIIGIIFLIIGLLILFRIDKRIESELLISPVLNNINPNKIEQEFLNKLI